MSGRHPRLRSTLAALTLTTVATMAGLLLIEAAFRLAPSLLLPAGSYGAGVRNPLLGMTVHGARVLYTKAGFVERTPNREGFMDVDHEIAKRPGITRVGFFGDSYVEAVQVPLDRVFFRRLPALTRDPVETLGFGISGWGTLQAKRAFDVFGARYALDVAVYVFVENDPGNNCFDLAVSSGESGSGMPYAELDPGGTAYRIRWITEPGREPWWYGIGKWLQYHSLLAHVVMDRIELLSQHGLQARRTAQSVQMSTVASAVPDVNDLPSTWPRPYVERAERLGGILLREWRDAAAGDRIGFLVLYVPRGESQLTGTLPQKDTRLPWLRTTCTSLRIPLLDPSAALLQRLQAGDHVYDDHWTAAGHDVIARVLADSLGSSAPRTGGTGATDRTAAQP